MNTSQKDAVKNAALAYLKQHQLSANELATNTGINSSYISQILNGKYVARAGDKEVVIGDKYFQKLASTVGLSIKKTYWDIVPTVQFREIIAVLEDRKESSRVGMIIAETGAGKTHAVDRFCIMNPRHTFRLTVDSEYKLAHIVNELCDLVGVELKTLNISFSRSQNHYSMKLRMDRMVEKLSDIRQSGGNPIIILDEAENLKPPVLQALKGIYDKLKGECAIVLIGTDQLLGNILSGLKNNRAGMPQFWRRFKAGKVQLTSINRLHSFKPFLEKYVPDKGLQELLISICDNYGDLNDYLEPALREADRRGEELTEELFRIMNKMPKR